ncbi:MAG TPA: hypothetical protein VLE27_05235 [Thermoanaerobaculia bacterium]|nr:hypothetical protein [Thermoanaerobaculia bacterium]
MKNFLGKLFALSLVIAATATAPVPSEAACTCTVSQRNECRIYCSQWGCAGSCDWTTCNGCQCTCG